MFVFLGMIFMVVGEDKVYRSYYLCIFGVFVIILRIGILLLNKLVKRFIN